MPSPAPRRLPAALLALTCVVAVASVALSAGREAVYDTVFYPLNGVVLAVVGALIAARRRGNGIGWVLLGAGVLDAVVELLEGYGYHADLPAAVPMQWASAWMSQVGIGSTAIVLALFPSGRARGAGARLALWLAVTGTVLMVVGTAFGSTSDAAFSGGSNPYAVGGGVPDVVYTVGTICFGVALLVAVAVLVVRFRRSTGVERQQLKWIAYAVALLGVVGPAALLAYWDSVLVQLAIAVVVTAFPIAVGIAILRHRLYDIDVLINRTVVYLALTVLLAAAYALTALTLGALVGGRQSPWVTAGATLVAAAAFRPLRARVQDAVDQRFRRARFDALHQVDAFLEDLRTGRVAPEALESVLRGVLSRPDLALAYVQPEGGGRIDAHGTPVGADDADGRTRARVERSGVLLAVADYSARDATADAAPPQLVEEVLARAGLGIEIARLRAEVSHRLAEVEASRARIVAAGHAERRRLERDLHDGAQQRLVSIGLALRHAQHRLGPSPVSGDLEAAVGELGVAIRELRELANGMRPSYLDDGLDVALRELAGRTPLPVTVRAGTERYPDDVEATAYFVACEAVTNVVKHSAATGVQLTAVRLDGHLVVTVTDDGVGGAAAGRGSGLRGLADRVAAQGGRVRVDSPPGRGTTLVAELPCAS